MHMSQRLVISELRLLLEHFTTDPTPDPDFMRSHLSALSVALESWAEEVEEPVNNEESLRRRSR